MSANGVELVKEENNGIDQPIELEKALLEMLDVIKSELKKSNEIYNRVNDLEGKMSALFKMLDVIKSELKKSNEIYNRVNDLEGKMSAFFTDEGAIDPKVFVDLMNLPYPQEELEKAVLILGIIGLLPKNEEISTTFLEEQKMSVLIDKIARDGIIKDLVDRTKEVGELKEKINDLEGKMSALFTDKGTIDPKVFVDLMNLPYPQEELEKAVLNRTKEVEELQKKISDLEQKVIVNQISEERKQYLLKMIDESIIKILHKKGVMLLRKGLYDDAHKCFHEIIKSNPNIKEAWLNMGIALGKLGQVEKEIECYDKAIEIDENYELAKSNREVALKNVGGKDAKV
jgi:tetratricopeptide (TPR) repeat protein